MLFWVIHFGSHCLSLVLSYSIIMFPCMYISFRQGSSLLWTHTLRPYFVSLLSSKFRRRCKLCAVFMDHPVYRPLDMSQVSPCFALEIAPSRVRICTLIQYMVPWAHPSPHPKRHLNQFICFCRAHGCGRQTDRLTDRPRYSICSNRLHTTSLRCSLIIHALENYLTYATRNVAHPSNNCCTDNNYYYIEL